MGLNWAKNYNNNFQQPPSPQMVVRFISCFSTDKKQDGHLLHYNFYILLFVNLFQPF